jgi:hypothetical protein
MDNNTSSLSITFFDGLQLLLIGLKLGHVIDWSWWLVASPFLLTAFTAFLVPAVFHLVTHVRRNRRNRR